MASKRPRRGRPGPNVLVDGDTGPTEPQGGARVREMFRESGDLESREFGVPQADVPGGKTHVVNSQTVPERPPGVPDRPADYHKYHGVPSDDGPYETPDDTVGRAPRPAPVPELQEAVPVYIVERGVGKRKSKWVAYTDTINLPAVGNDPAVLCNRDEDRDEVMLLCTSGTNNVLFSDSYASLAAATATTHGGCGFLSKSATAYTRVATQDTLYATSDAASASQVSVVIITEVPALRVPPDVLVSPAIGGRQRGVGAGSRHLRVEPGGRVGAARRGQRLPARDDRGR
jgi:hypothetical protein